MIPRIDTVRWTPERGWRGKLLCGQTGILEPRKTLFVLVIRLRGDPPVFLVLGRPSWEAHPGGDICRTRCCLCTYHV